MRIAIVLMKYNPFGGYERQAAILAEEMRGRGHEVTVFANDWKGGERNGIIFRKVPMLKWASWLKVLSFAVMSRRLLEAEPFDAVIAFDRSLSMDVYRAGNACHREWMAFRKRHGGARESLSMAINPLHVVINGIERRIFSRIQEKKGTIVVLSQLGREQIRRHYDVDDERFAVIPPVVDLAARKGRGEKEALHPGRYYGTAPRRLGFSHKGTLGHYRGARPAFRARQGVRAAGGRLGQEGDRGA